jgi:cysteine desulfurase/selenocysteine lyase
MFNPHDYKRDFPILQRQVHGKPLVYLDNAATSQKPTQVISAITEYYQHHNANVHRGVHQLGDESTQLFHSSRQQIARFFGAEAEELVVVRNTTEAVNQVAYTWGEQHISAGDVILLTELEHHSNVVPWQQLAQRKQAQLVYIPVTPEGVLDWQTWFASHQDLVERTKLLALTHISNTLGTVTPVTEIIQAFKAVNPELTIFVDGAQAAPHVPVDFHALGADFYAVSAHKMLGPMGIGGLLVKRSLLEHLPPFLTGGGMIDTVTWSETTFAENLEDRFTAGTPDVAGLVGWAAACEYLQAIGMRTLLKHDQELVTACYQMLEQQPRLKLIGPNPLVENETDQPEKRVGSVAFIYDGVHAHDLGQVLDSEGVAVRSGHHCTMPLHTKFNWVASTRVSFQLYNTIDDLEALLRALAKVEKVFGV